MHRPRVRARTVAAGVATLSMLVAAACAPARAEDEIVFWTNLVGEIDIEGQQMMIDAFEEEHPGTTVRIVRKPNNFTADASSLITAVRSGNPPDVMMLDRFTVGQSAATGLLTNLDEYIEDEGGQRFLDNYFDFTIDEGSFDGSVYAMPTDTDARGLYYNKEMFREAGVDMDFLDPESGSPTMDEVMEAALELTEQAPNGAYTQLGFHPWHAQAFHSTWALGRDAQYFDNESCEITPQEPALLETMEFFDNWSQRLGYDRLSAFEATYQPPEAPPEQGMFLTGRLAMAIDVNNYLSILRDYAPDLDFGITYLPVENEGDDPFTWSGGFSLGVPHGAADPDKSWEFVKFMTGPEAAGTWVKQTERMPAWEDLVYDDEVTGEQGIFREMMEYSKSRPPLPVGGQLSDALDTAQESVLLGEETPREAMQTVYDRVQPQTEQYCPFTMPE